MAGRNPQSNPFKNINVFDMNNILGNSSIETYNKMNKIMIYLRKFNNEDKKTIIDNILTKCAFIDAQNVINNLNNAINCDKTEKKRKYSMISEDIPIPQENHENQEIPLINDPVH